MDKRILKSTQKIKNAYLDMLFKIEPNKIQVKDLCLAAHVNRSTFYERFGFIETLESEIIEEEMKKITFDGIQIDALPKESDGIDKELIRKYIKSFCGNKILIRMCTVENREKYVDIIAHNQIKICASALTEVSYYGAYFQCIGALATIIEWVNNHKNQSLNDIVDIVYNHSIAMFAK